MVSLPLAAEIAVEDAHVRDRLGTLPVEVRLARNGVTTLDTGILGKLCWHRTTPVGDRIDLGLAPEPSLGTSATLAR